MGGSSSWAGRGGRVALVLVFAWAGCTWLYESASVLPTPTTVALPATTTAGSCAVRPEAFVAADARRSFAAIANELPLDKVPSAAWGGAWRPHNYGSLYERHLGPLRATPLALLEIGLGCFPMPQGAGHSVALWRRFLPCARLHVLELDGACAEPFRGAVEGLFVGDQSSARVLDEALRSGPYTVAIDDGSHAAPHVIASLTHLFPHLAPGGVYVIEDLQVSIDGTSSLASAQPAQLFVAAVSLFLTATEAGRESLLGGAEHLAAWAAPAARELAAFVEHIDCGPAVCAIVRNNRSSVVAAPAPSLPDVPTPVLPDVASLPAAAALPDDAPATEPRADAAAPSPSPRALGFVLTAWYAPAWHNCLGTWSGMSKLLDSCAALDVRVAIVHDAPAACEAALAALRPDLRLHRRPSPSALHAWDERWLQYDALLRALPPDAAAYIAVLDARDVSVHRDPLAVFAASPAVDLFTLLQPTPPDGWVLERAAACGLVDTAACLEQRMVNAGAIGGTFEAVRLLVRTMAARLTSLPTPYGALARSLGVDQALICHVVRHDLAPLVRVEFNDTAPFAFAYPRSAAFKPESNVDVHVATCAREGDACVCGAPTACECVRFAVLHKATLVCDDQAPTVQHAARALPRALSERLRGVHSLLDRVGAGYKGSGMGHIGDRPEQSLLLLDAVRSFARGQGAHLWTKLGRARAPVRTVCEVGFNLGHSAAVLLTATWDARARASSVGHFLAFDSKVSVASVALLREAFPATRFELVEGLSGDTVPRFAPAEELLCDVIHVDACHDEACVLEDVRNMRRLAAPGALVVLDDCECGAAAQWCVGPTAALGALVAEGVLTVLSRGDIALGGDVPKGSCFARFAAAGAPPPQ